MGRQKFMRGHDVANLNCGVLGHDRSDALGTEEFFARQAVVEDQADRIDIAALIELFSGELLGTHVKRCAEDHARLGE